MGKSVPSIWLENILKYEENLSHGQNSVKKVINCLARFVCLCVCSNSHNAVSLNLSGTYS